MINQIRCLIGSKSAKAAIFSAALMGLTATSAQAQVSIDTMPNWNGTTFISSFGVTDTATYGQTITVGNGASPLVSYTFQIGNCSAQVTFRGYVYAWDSVNNRATGPALFSSPAQTLAASATYTPVIFNVGSLSLPPGQYVLFASTSNDQSGAPASACRWGALTNNTAIPGGQFVFINNGPNPAQWTSNSWSNIGEDLAITVNGLYVPVVPASVPTLSEWALIAMASLLGLFGMGAVRRRGGSMFR